MSTGNKNTTTYASKKKPHIMTLEDVDQGNVVTNSTTNRKTESSDYINYKFQGLQLYDRPTSLMDEVKTDQKLGVAGVVAGGVGTVLTAVNGVKLLPIALIAAGVGGIGLLIYSLFKKGRVKRFTEYLKALGKKTLITFEELSEKTGKSVSFLKKDVNKMIEKKLFHYGHVDNDEVYLITADETYKNYLEYEKQEENRKNEILVMENELREKGMTAEGIRIVREGEAYIEKIHRINEKLPEKLVSDKLYRLEDAVTALVEEVKKQPGKVDQLRKIMNYYLPTTEKLMNAYIEMEREENKDQQLYDSQAEIKETLDTINESFEKLLTKMETERSWDVSTDISVLNTMLSLEGLKPKDDFKTNESKEEQ